jgi:voltage-gated potassium channel Kch
MNASGLFGHKVLHYGEVQAGNSNVFRKRTQFIVLTESHLIRFRSQVKAAEMFPSIPSSLTRGHVPRTSSVSSYQELQMSAYSDITSGIPLDQVVAVYTAEDGRMAPTLEVAHLDERGRRAMTMQIQLNDTREDSFCSGTSEISTAAANPESHD